VGLDPTARDRWSGARGGGDLSRGLRGPSYRGLLSSSSRKSFDLLLQGSEEVSGGGRGANRCIIWDGGSDTCEGQDLSLEFMG